MKMSLTGNIDSFNLKETKKKVKDYFVDLEELKWEYARLSAQKGLVTRYKLLPEDKNQPYVSVGQDEFNLSAKEVNAEELKIHLSGYYWAQRILSEKEQLYIAEYFVNGKFEDEVVGLLGLSNISSRAFRKIKRRAIYKFAYVLNLVV